MDKGFYNQRFDSIQLLRAVAAVSVIFNHIAFIGKGAFGVDIFFCISGFIMMYVTEADDGHFLAKRLIRIAPLYYSITLATFAGMIVAPGIFERPDADVAMLIKSLLFIPYRSGGTIQPIVKVGWTLNYEMFFYLIMWISLKAGKKYRSVTATAIIFLLVLFGRFFDGESAVIEFWTSPVMLEFVFGMLSYEIHKRSAAYYGKLNVSVRLPLFLLGTCAYALLWIVDSGGAYSGDFRFLIYGVPAFIIFNFIFIAGYGIRLPKIAVWLGDISYSVYLLHYFIIRLYDRFIASGVGYGVRTVFGTALAFLLILCLGALSHFIFEKRLNAYLRRKLLDSK